MVQICWGCMIRFVDGVWDCAVKYFFKNIFGIHVSGYGYKMKWGCKTGVEVRSWLQNEVELIINGVDIIIIIILSKMN
jgi:hypothetical protein